MRHEDELIGIHSFNDSSQELAEKQVQEQLKRDAEARVRYYKQLIDLPAFDLFMHDIKQDMDTAEAMMEKANDAISLAKATATYLTLKGVHQHALKEYTTHSTFLARLK